jgi:hypothetical protein
MQIEVRVSLIDLKRAFRRLLARLREPSLQELSQLRRRPKLGNRVEFLEG